MQSPRIYNRPAWWAMNVSLRDDVRWHDEQWDTKEVVEHDGYIICLLQTNVNIFNMVKIEESSDVRGSLVV